MKWHDWTVRHWASSTYNWHWPSLIIYEFSSQCSRTLLLVLKLKLTHLQFRKFGSRNFLTTLIHQFWNLTWFVQSIFNYKWELIINFFVVINFNSCKYLLLIFFKPFIYFSSSLLIIINFIVVYILLLNNLFTLFDLSVHFVLLSFLFLLKIVIIILNLKVHRCCLWA